MSTHGFRLLSGALATVPQDRLKAMLHLMTKKGTVQKARLHERSHDRKQSKPGWLSSQAWSLRTEQKASRRGRPVSGGQKKQKLCQVPGAAACTCGESLDSGGLCCLRHLRTAVELNPSTIARERHCSAGLAKITSHPAKAKVVKARWAGTASSPATCDLWNSTDVPTKAENLSPCGDAASPT